MPRARVVESDPSLTHQIRLVQVGVQTAVMCNCSKYLALAYIMPMDDPWPIFNNPEKHDNTVEQFVPRASHATNRKVFDVP